MNERGDRLGSWCGWVLVGAAALTPLMAWLGPLGFALLVSLMGLLCLPALRVGKEDMLSLGDAVGLASEKLYFEIRVENRPEDPLGWLR